jgi:predicted nucleic acid-binding protein
VILVDANAWISHLRKADPQLVGFLKHLRVRTCDVVIGELRLGSGLPKTFSSDLSALPRLPSPTALETRTFIERHAQTFAGSGVGWADTQIILSAAKSGARLHTSDRSVRRVCVQLGLALA